MTAALKRAIAFLEKYSGLFLISITCLVGLLTYGDYGVSWDEMEQRGIGMVNWNYVRHGDPKLLTFVSRDHGAAFEMPLIMIEKAFHLEDTYDMFRMRHLVSHMFFLLGAICIFLLADLLYRNKLLSCIAFLLYILHPHIYAHSFFNTKDIPFLSLMTICFYLAARAFRSKSLASAMLLGAALGVLTNIRVMGVLLLPCILFVLFMDAWREGSWKLHIRFLVCMAIPGLLLFYISGPYLWKDPLHSFYDTFKSMSRFKWESTVLFRGSIVKATEIGKDYIPVWFAITTPIPYLIGGAAGSVALVWTFLKTRFAFLNDLRGKCNLMFLVCFFAPVLAVIVFRSVLYDGWRHLFFIYPAFCMLVVYAIYRLSGYLRKIAIGVSLASFLWIGWFMVSNAPLQHLYFNAIITRHTEPEYIHYHYDMDYWGTSYKEALEYLLETDTSAVIRINSENAPGIYNYQGLSPEQRSRFQLVPFQYAKYFMSNYRWHLEDYPFEDKKIHAIKVLDNTVNGIYKLQ